MPIPTDTFWNIKRLNWIFAVSAVVLFAATAWSILQDWGRAWRVPQRNARVWDAALVTEKINTALGADQKDRVKQLEQQLAEVTPKIESADKAYQQRVAQKQQLESDAATIEFNLNTTKSNVAVLESNLQDAKTAGDAERVGQIQRALAGPRKELSELAEKFAAMTTQIAEAKTDIDTRRADLDAMIRERAMITGDVELMKKKLAALQPDSIFAKGSAILRDFPLMGFVNPAERVKQVVLPDVQTDVAFMKITTVDRCATCHVNVQNKDFTEARLLDYLQQQLATARALVLPAKVSGNEPPATASHPGVAAMPEFWHAWARELAPDAFKKSAAKLRLVTNTVGKTAKVWYDGTEITSFAFDPALTAAPPTATTRPWLAPESQDAVLLELLRAWSMFNTNGTTISQTGRVKVEISGVTEAQAKPIRNLALRYPVELHDGIAAAIPVDAFRLLQHRYRWALVREVNLARRLEGYKALDPSPVYLAHPKLDLYASQDSPHPMDAEGAKLGVGCTSCHDGSGQETDFVTAAHVPRPIWVDQKTGEPVLTTQLVDPPKPHHDFSMASMLHAIYPEGTVAPVHATDLHLASAAHEDPHATTQPAASVVASVVDRLKLPAPDSTPRPFEYVDPVTGKRGKAVSQAEFWRRKYEPGAPQSFETTYHYWDWPMRQPQYIQANCVRCHTEILDIKEEALTLYEGRRLFAELGCVNCHQMDSIREQVVPVNPSTGEKADRQFVMANGQVKVGPDLRHVTSKLSPAFINTWMWSPKAFRPSTRMPHFFMLENNSSDEELRRTRQEARAMTEYLTRTAEPLPSAHPIPPGAKGSAEAGKGLFNTLGCLACHQNLNERGQEWITTDLVKRAGVKPDEARKLFDEMSYNERQIYVMVNLEERPGATEAPRYADGSPKPIFIHIGPELSGIGTKLLAERKPEQARQWLYQWLKEPRHYSDYTIMPQLRVTDQEAMDLVEYLLEQKRTTTSPKDTWAAGLTPVDTAKLIELTSLFLRSRYSAHTATQKADDAKELRDLAIDALKSKKISHADAEAMVAEIEKQPDGRDTLRMLFLGKKLIAHYGCMSCHAINGAEEVTSPCANLSDWGQKGLDKLDFGYLDHHKQSELPRTSKLPMINGLSAEAANLVHEAISAEKKIAHEVEAAWPHVGHNRVDWISLKLSNPRAYDRGKMLLEPTDNDPGKPFDKLRMPTFYLTDEQVQAIVTFVISNRDRLISHNMTSRATNEQARQIARGRELVERYNCVGCHQVDHNYPQIQQYAKPEDITEKWPPSLRGEGNKTQHAWLFRFFRNVEPLRPLLVPLIRMPSFPAADEEWKAIIAYFHAISAKESRQLANWMDPLIKDMEGRLRASKSTTRPSDAWPEPDWWSDPKFKSVADRLREWGLREGLIKQVEVDPKTADYNKLYAKLLFYARFIQHLYNAPYPFVDSGMPDRAGMTAAQFEAHFKLGEQLFYEMQCLKCHVLGDPDVPGAQKNPTAPSLSLTYQRLQRPWVRNWVQEPGVIQIGTKMPPFLTGFAIMNLHGQAWPRSQGAAADEVKRVEAKFGDTADEQAALLLDFIYEAGARGYTGIQPSAPTAAPTTAPAHVPPAATAPGPAAATTPATAPAK